MLVRRWNLMTPLSQALIQMLIYSLGTVYICIFLVESEDDVGLRNDLSPCVYHQPHDKVFLKGQIKILYSPKMKKKKKKLVYNKNILAIATCASAVYTKSGTLLQGLNKTRAFRNRYIAKWHGLRHIDETTGFQHQ